MTRRVFYHLVDTPNGLFDAVVRIEPDTIMQRDGFASLAEFEEWIAGLRVLMAALGAPVIRETEVGATHVVEGITPGV